MDFDFAVKHTDSTTIRILLAAGANHKRSCILMRRDIWSDIGLVKYIINDDADLCENLLWSTMYDDRYEVFKLLLASGVKLAKTNILLHSLDYDSKYMTHIIGTDIKRGHEISQAEYEYIFETACHNADAEKFALLLIGFGDRLTVDIAAHLITRLIDCNRYEILKLLLSLCLEKKINVLRWKSQYNVTLFTTAAWKSPMMHRLMVVAELAWYGTYHRDKFSDSPCATETGNLDLMLALGMDPNTKYKGVPLLMSCFNQYKDFILLLENGADPNSKSDAGETPLTVYTDVFHANYVKSLLEYGADPNITNARGETPLSIAKQYKKLRIVKLLNEAGGV